MSEYEFWDELGNIFNAIIAYQHKTVEFNKRFVNPWLRLGTVFDQEDHNSDALIAARKSIEIDEGSGTNWLSLGDVYFKMGSFDDAACAYGKAIELNPNLGWAYANLALTSATRQKYTKAVNLYIKSLELIDDDKDRAMIWNRLGNVYRKVNDYENAFIAFQMADEFDGENTGFHDQLDEVTLEQRVMPIVAEVYVNNKSQSPTTVDEKEAVSIEDERQSEEVEDVLVDEPVTQSQQTDLLDELTAEETSYQEAFVLAVQSKSENETAPDEPAADMTQSGAMDNISEDETLIKAEQSDVEDVSTANEIEELQSVVADETSTEEVAVDTEQPEIVDTANSDEIVAENVQPDRSVEDSQDTPVDNDPQAVLNEEAVDEESFSEAAELDSLDESLVEEAISEAEQSESADISTSEEIDVESAESEVAMEESTGLSIASDEMSVDSVSTETDEIATADETDIVAESEAVEEAVNTETVPDEAQTESSEGNPVEDSVGVVEQPEIEDEALLDESDADITVSEADEKTALEDTELETVEENPDEDPATVSEQPDAEEGVSLEVTTAVDDTQDEEDVEVQLDVTDEFTADKSVIEETEHVDPSSDTTIAYIDSQGFETLVDQSSLNQPVILVVDDLNELVKGAGSDIDDESVTSPSIVMETQSETDEPVVEQPETAPENGDVAEIVSEIVSLANTENKVETTEKEVQPGAHQESDSSLVAEIVNPVSSDEKNQPLDFDNEPAYEEFLKNAVAPVSISNEGPVKNDLKVEPDTKNAHVWNELGNVYFNTGAFEEAVTAYSKAIELDDWFAWPYSNLALVYVQKEKYAEAILLYQRSIELFSSDKDKAITWNRLGNVYRRLADYDNAIECYQRADELDPNNATRSLRSRFSLLGNLNVEQTESIAG